MEGICLYGFAWKLAAVGGERWIIYIFYFAPLPNDAGTIHAIGKK